jgi:MFS family permease
MMHGARYKTLMARGDTARQVPLIQFIAQNARFVGAGFLLTLLSSVGQTFFISIFSGHIRTAFDLSHAAWGTTYAIATFGSAIVLIWAGGLTDILRTRILGALVLLGLAGAALFMARNTSVLGLGIALFLLRFMGQGMASHLASTAMARWFSAQRGRALALSSLGFSLGEAVLPVTCVFLLTLYSWQSLWAVSALVAALSAPLLYWMLQYERTPQDMATEAQSTGMQARQWRRAEALRHPLFWWMIPVMIGPPAFITAFFFQQVPYAEGKGWSHLVLVSAFPLYTVMTVTFTQIAGWIQDRFGLIHVLGFAQVPMVFAFVAFAAAPTAGWLILGLFFVALTSGTMPTWFRGFWAEFYGTQHLGAIKALATAIMVFGSAVGPVVTGAGLDHGMTMDQQYLWVSVYFIMSSAILYAAIVRYRRDL